MNDPERDQMLMDKMTAITDLWQLHTADANALVNKLVDRVKLGECSLTTERAILMAHRAFKRATETLECAKAMLDAESKPKEES